MLFIDIMHYQVLQLKTRDGNWVYPSDDIQEIYDDIGFMVDDIRIMNIRGKSVYICSQKIKLKLSNKFIEHKWCSSETDICDTVKTIFQ